MAAQPPTPQQRAAGDPITAIQDHLSLALPSFQSRETSSKSSTLPTSTVHESRRLVLASVGKLTELVSDPSNRLLEVSSQYWESRGLFIAAERRIANLIAAGDNGSGKGVGTETLAKQTGVETGKLERVMRCLCSIGIFAETPSGAFANNRISAALVDNEPLRAYILLFGLDIYTASDHLPSTLLSSTKGPSYDVDKTAFQDAVGTTKPRWEWLEEQVPVDELRVTSSGYPGTPDLVSRCPKPNDTGVQPNGITQKQVNGVDNTQVNGVHNSNQDLHKRPELEIFGLAMLGGGKVFGEAHVYDYPWDTLGPATVVDVGGGVGGFCIQLSKQYPSLNFVVQDRGPALSQARSTVWPKEAPDVLASGRVQFVQHDFFQPNPAHGADIFWLRYIIHDWSDAYCIRILSALKPAMTRQSRVLICDQVMNTTTGSKELASAPWPLPANYGYWTRYAHQRDLAMMGIINGIERTPEQFRSIVERAGLRLVKVWECRSCVGIVECALP